MLERLGHYSKRIGKKVDIRRGWATSFQLVTPRALGFLGQKHAGMVCAVLLVPEVRLPGGMSFMQLILGFPLMDDAGLRWRGPNPAAPKPIPRIATGFKHST